MPKRSRTSPQPWNCSDLAGHARATQQELAFQITLGPVLIATKGYAAPEVEPRLHSSAGAMSAGGRDSQLFPVLGGLWRISGPGEFQTAHELAEQLLSLAQSIHDSAFLVGAHTAWGDLPLPGRLMPARAHSEQGIALYDPQQRRARAFLYGGADPGVMASPHAALALWCLAIRTKH